MIHTRISLNGLIRSKDRTVGSLVSHVCASLVSRYQLCKERMCTWRTFLFLLEKTHFQRRSNYMKPKKGYKSCPPGLKWWRYSKGEVTSRAVYKCMILMDIFARVIAVAKEISFLWCLRKLFIQSRMCTRGRTASPFWQLEKGLIKNNKTKADDCPFYFLSLKKKVCILIN